MHWANRTASQRLHLRIPELRLNNYADVLAIESCPAILDGPGEVVTATYHTDRAPVIDLQFSGLKDPLGATPSHPFWSVSRQTFIPAGELVLGEEVVALDGQTIRLTSITPRAGPEPVFNLEVANEHTYYVSRDGLLVHNAKYLTKAGREGKLAKKTTAKPKNVQRAKKAEEIDMHHSTPRGIQERLKDAGNKNFNHPDIVGRPGLPNRIPVPRARHREIHGGKGFVGKDLDGVGGGYYSNAFHRAIMDNGGYRRISVEKILEIRDSLVRKFGL